MIIEKCIIRCTTIPIDVPR